MTKTPYEIRLELIKLAQDQLNQKYYSTLEKIRDHETGHFLEEVPQFPNTQQILMEAEILKSFVDKQ
jgi:hypothetical protein